MRHRVMYYEESSLEIKVKPMAEDGNEYAYSFDSLSDGEKAVFYYIGHVLFAKENSYIVVDEPEDHLHPAIVLKLWDVVENLRKDCKFIYLTHDCDFAASRRADKFWSKSFTAPADWDIESLSSCEELPEALLMELLGVRQNILFCEGKNGSLDNRLYGLFFPDYKIVPAGSCSNVIKYTRAYNQSQFLKQSKPGSKAIGIIDGDFYEDDEKETWEKNLYIV